MADFLDEKRKEIQARLKELKPLVEEYNKLPAADQALGPRPDMGLNFFQLFINTCPLGQ